MSPPPARLTAVVLLATLALPADAGACPVCFGAADSLLLDGARYGVAVMAGVTVGVLLAFGRWFLKLRSLQPKDDTT
jgi:hypothetical protein